MPSPTVISIALLLCGPAVAWPQNVQQQAGLPRVLLIGDSISQGYTPHVISLLKGEADVRRHPGNAQHTGTGLKKIDAWLGSERWDVIHFNWGLWDLCYRNAKSKNQGRRDKAEGALTTSLEQYEQNLDALVKRLRRTGAELIWAHTTVVPEGELGRKVNDDRLYNEAAARVMKKHGVVINDLNQLTRSFAPDQFTAPGNVHFTPAGSKRIAEQVSGEIRAALRRRARP